MGILSFNGPVSALVAGLTLAAVLYTGYFQYQRQAYLSTPITAMFQSDVIVPDFNVGENPQVQYDRTIFQSFIGSYRVEVKDAATGVTICSGQGSNISYDAGEKVPTDTTLMWYVGDVCATKLLPGQYYLETNYVISQEGLPNRYYSTKSNVFKVHK